jgi:hypothetical protein
MLRMCEHRFKIQARVCAEIELRYARRSRLEKQPTRPAMAGRKPCYLWDGTLGARDFIEGLISTVDDFRE